MMSRSTLSRAVLEALPQSLYRALPAPEVTADLCASAVSRAMASRNAHIVRDWVSYEASAPSREQLMEVLDVAIDLELRSSSLKAANTFVEHMRESVRSALPAQQTTRNDIDAVIAGLHTAIGIYNQKLGAHSSAAAALAVRVARAADFENPAAQHISRASLVHELGRLHVDRNLSESQNVFTPDELARMRNGLGDIKLGNEPELQAISETVYRLYNEDAVSSSPEVNIIRVVDTFLTLCEPRPYRPALDPTHAITSMRTSIDARLDPSFVALLRDLVAPRSHDARIA